MDVYTTTASGAAGVWWFVLGAALLVFALYSAVLIYHWFAFSMKPRIAVVATVMYMTVSAVFVLGMIGSVLALA